MCVIVDQTSGPEASTSMKKSAHASWVGPKFPLVELENTASQAGRHVPPSACQTAGAFRSILGRWGHMSHRKQPELLSQHVA